VLTAKGRRLSEDLRLDANAEDFSLLGNFLVSPDGRLAIPLSQDLQWRLYTPLGQRIAVLGRKGSGPGEFQAISAYSGWIGDTLWTADGSLARITFISPDGKLLRTIRLARQAPVPATGLTTWTPFALHADGTQMSWIASEEDGHLSHFFVRISPTGSILDTTAHLPPLWAEDLPAAKGTFGSRVPFVAVAMYDVAGDGSRVTIVTTSMQDPKNLFYRVTRVTERGDTIFAKNYPFVGVPIPERVIDSVLAGLPMSAAPAQVRSLIPKFWRPIFQVKDGLDATVWLRLQPTDNGIPWAVLDEMGVPLDTVVVPKNVQLVQADRNHVWGLESDADDLKSIVRFLISPPIGK
jgi:hypothetical protein